jgi:hypothetical protein
VTAFSLTQQLHHDVPLSLQRPIGEPRQPDLSHLFDPEASTQLQHQVKRAVSRASVLLRVERERADDRSGQGQPGVRCRHLGPRRSDGPARLLTTERFRDVST